MYINIKYVHQYIEAHLGSEKHRRNETDPAVQGVHVGDWAGSFVIVAVKCRLEKKREILQSCKIVAKRQKCIWIWANMRTDGFLQCL